MKKKLLFLVAALALFVPSVMAAEVTDVASLKTCLTDGGTCKVTKDVTVNDGTPIAVTKDVTLDLNGKSIEFKGQNDYIKLEKGHLNITGTGKMFKEIKALHVLEVESTGTKKDTNYATLTIGKDAVIEGGFDALLIDNYNSASYGATVNVYGTLKSNKNASINVNGVIKNTENAPVINVYKGAKLTSYDTGIYGAGYANYNIYGGTIYGETYAGMEVRAGKLTITDGEVSTDAAPVSVTENGNGSTVKGAAVAISQHTTKLSLEVSITGGTFKGFSALYQANPEGNEEEAVAKVTLSVTGGTFITTNTEEEKKVVYSENKRRFITGGTFSSDVTEYLPDTYVSEKEGTNYVVKENKVLSTEDKNVTFESEKAIDSTNILKVTKNEDKEVAQTVTDLYKENTKVKDTKVLVVYDINVVNANGGVVEMRNGKYTITVTLPNDKLNFEVYKVIYVDEEGKASEPLDAEVVDGKLVFTTTHLSTYAVVGYNNVKDNKNEVEEETPKTDATEETKKEENPETGDINLVLIALVISSAVAGVVVTSKKISAKVTR